MNTLSDSDPNKKKLIAFYLPQFHPVKENSNWWGQGFTEWTNVAKALPNYTGHYQPHVPKDLGFYDLRLLEVMKEQAKLAETYGLSGFCFYWYWFNGRRILEMPVEMYFQNKISFPFCFCWANENWTRTWSGNNNDVLLEQKYSAQDDLELIDALIPYFKDERYIKVDEKPVLLVYRVNNLPNPNETAKRWQRRVVDAGLPGIHLCIVQHPGAHDPRDWGFEAAVEFPPHGYTGSENNYTDKTNLINKNYIGTILDYKKIMRQAIDRPLPEYTLYRGIVPSWDNTARKQDSSLILQNSSPENYQTWLSTLIKKDQETNRNSSFIFINAWNEWAEGCHLEPDLRYGRKYLEATLQSISNHSISDLAVESPVNPHETHSYKTQEQKSQSKYRKRLRLSLKNTIIFLLRPIKSQIKQLAILFSRLNRILE